MICHKLAGKRLLFGKHQVIKTCDQLAIPLHDEYGQMSTVTKWHRDREAHTHTCMGTHTHTHMHTHTHTQTHTHKKKTLAY